MPGTAPPHTFRRPHEFHEVHGARHEMRLDAAVGGVREQRPGAEGLVQLRQGRAQGGARAEEVVRGGQRGAHVPGQDAARVDGDARLTGR